MTGSLFCKFYEKILLFYKNFFPTILKEWLLPKRKPSPHDFFSRATAKIRHCDFTSTESDSHCTVKHQPFPSVIFLTLMEQNC